MSNYKKIRRDSELTLNFAKMCDIMIPFAKPKFKELFINLIRNRIKINDIETLTIKQDFSYRYNINYDRIKKIEFEDIVHMLFIEFLIKEDDYKELMDFIEFYEKNLTVERDLTKLHSFDDIKKENHHAQFNSYKKVKDDEIHKIFEDDEWLVLRPITFFSSLKYGAGTKWCTAMRTEPTRFADYIASGILVYCINKIENFKIGISESLPQSDNHQINYNDINICFFNEMDIRIDSFLTKIPHKLLEIIFNEFSNNRVTNFSLMTGKLKKIEKLRNKEFFQYLCDRTNDKICLELNNQYE